MISLAEYRALRSAQIEAALDGLLPAAGEPPAALHEAMRYAVLGGGKRLRGTLVLAACEAVGGEPERVLPLAAAVELVHAYSLVHDDLPCMDDDDLRRGKPTVHRRYGEGLAVLVGDALLTRAFEVLFLLPRLTDIPPATAQEIGWELAQAAGSTGMIAGQVLDLAAEGRPARVEEIREIHLRKTAALIRAAVRAGGMAAGAPPPVLAALGAYGEALGLGFQIVDDMLDVVGDRERLGKEVGADRRRQKATYPAAAGLANARGAAVEAIRRAEAALAPLGEQAEPLVALARFVLERQV